jgi:hypothetical protein
MVVPYEVPLKVEGRRVAERRTRWFRPGLELGLVDRAPVLWRFRSARCRWMERWKGAEQ